MIPLSVPDLRGREREYLARCVDDNWVSSAGPFVIEMERRMAALCERRFAVATVNGTAALHLALVAAGVAPDDLVIVPDWTFAATANAVRHAGAQPYFVDVSRESWTLDPDLVARAIAEAPGRISAVIPVHAVGLPPDLDPMLRACAESGARVIEDAAGAIGARYRGRPAGAHGFAACFSFNGNKTVTAGGGGMIVTDDEGLAARARALSTQARRGDRYEHDAVAWNYRMTNLNAAVGVAQLERLDEMVASKRAIAARYDAAFERRNDLRPMPRTLWGEHNCWLYSVLCPSEPAADGLVAHLAASGVEARAFWRSLSAQAPWAGAPRLLTGVSAGLSGRVVSLPCSSHLAEADQARVIAAVDGWSATRKVA